ncbi:MAG TPA: lysophospholipid acyltransferase family protein [Thermoanaerobaculia bacterium]|nr:lysophospholipid acyltransferase family protein [Thermoanaerobaculia bacterium]
MAGPRLRAFRERTLYRALVVVSAVGRRIPLPLGRAFGRALGSLAWHVARRERRKALRHIGIAFPDWDDAKRRDTVRAMFRHLGMSLFEITWMRNMDVAMRDRLTVIEGAEPLLKLIDEGRGVVVFTAHCGNWEWMSYAVGLWGRPTTVLQRERDAPEMNRYITEHRARSGVRTIDRGSAAAGRELIQSLGRGGILAFLIDQNLRTDSVQVPFFGRPALTPIGPAKLAVRTESVVVDILIERLPDGRHRMKVGEPVQTKRDADPVALTARMTRIIEEQIRRVPEQWVWMHDRWRDRPQWDVGRTGQARPSED